MTFIDLNADVGEGVGNDREILAYATSANIACGAHAGDAASIEAAVRIAVEHGVAIGAHPGHEDRANFGRREIPISAECVHRLVTHQVAALAEVADRHGAAVRYVKLHGALYHQAGREAELAAAVAAAVAECAGGLALLGQAGSQLEHHAQRAGVVHYSEAFADRAYLSDGTLAPREMLGAVIDDLDAALSQAEQIVLRGAVECLDGHRLLVRCQSLCLHGDGPYAAHLAGEVWRVLTESGVRLRAFVDTPC